MWAPTRMTGPHWTPMRCRRSSRSCGLAGTSSSPSTRCFSVREDRVPKGGDMVEFGGTGQVVVVGVDASEESKLALRWALRQAQLTGASLRVVTAWNVSSLYDVDPGVPEHLDLTQTAEEELAAV